MLLQAFFQVPQPTLKALVPVLQGLDANTVTRQLKSLASQGSDTINKMIYFINNVSPKNLLLGETGWQQRHGVADAWLVCCMGSPWLV